MLLELELPAALVLGLSLTYVGSLLHVGQSRTSILSTVYEAVNTESLPKDCLKSDTKFDSLIDTTAASAVLQSGKVKRYATTTLRVLCNRLLRYRFRVALAVTDCTAHAVAVVTLPVMALQNLSVNAESCERLSAVRGAPVGAVIPMTTEPETIGVCKSAVGEPAVGEPAVVADCLIDVLTLALVDGLADCDVD